MGNKKKSDSSEKSGAPKGETPDPKQVDQKHREAEGKTFSGKGTEVKK